jgi:polyhydroxybutyrate depolymerase
MLLTVLLITGLISCAPKPTHNPEPGDSERKLTVGELERSYLLHIPPGVDLAYPVPVVFVFHEHPDTASSMQVLTGFNAISDKAGFLVVYPEGIGLSWNAGTCCGVAATKNVDEEAFVRKMLADVRTIVNIDTKRIYATGLSDGAALSYRLACEMSDTFAAVAPVAGSLLIDPCQPAQSISVMDVHGLNDDVVPYEGGGDFNTTPIEDVIHTWAQLDGCTNSPQVDKENTITHTRYASCKAGTVVELYAIEGGEHVWPSKDALDTSQIVWDFFAAHPKQ